MKNALVFGASGGIGSVLCRQLHASGWNLFLSARNPAGLEPLAAELGSGWRTADATRADEVDAVVKAAAEHMGGLHGVAHCVGSIVLKPAHLTPPELFLETLNLNLVSAFNVLRASVQTMTTGGGSVVLVSSVAAKLGLANHEAISAAKAGVEGLTRAAAATYASRQIRVNAVAPGLVKTPLSRSLTGSEAMLKASSAMHPLGRVGEPEDVASAIAWLLDPGNAWVTGQVIGVDGGLGALRTRG
jgi:3-oxoacyl-[acyl-carrier protein] reductase